mmetsp:Transcript_71649/g.213839  ORF Transcript_71649/g.213839 Transcript_71649/m.213839 type:complete len:226 (-) Transcript_71649:72-749(-)
MQVDAASYIALLIVTCIIVGCFWVAYSWELYRLHPDWGPIRKFDGIGNEALRIHQGLIHDHVSAVADPGPAQEYLVSKGSFPTDTPGLGYRASKVFEDKLGDDVYVEWGSKVRGIPTGDGWLEVDGKFLPMQMEGFPVVHLQERAYGRLGKCTWGQCEVPWMHAERIMHPIYGEVTLRHGFSDTQYLRQHSATWARDEPHFIQEAGLSCPRTVNSYGTTLTQGMV